MKSDIVTAMKCFICTRCEYEFEVRFVEQYEAPACPKCLDSEYVKRGQNLTV